jgi:hypothetical protein
MKKEITAKVYPKNLRDTHTSSPRVLLKDIEGVDRNYMWCGDKKLHKYIDRHNINKPTYISFQAEEYEYMNSKLETKIGLHKVSHIKEYNE